MVTGIFEDYDDTSKNSVFNDQESGTGHSPPETSQLEENEAEMSEDEIYWKNADRELKTYGEPVKNNDEPLQEGLLDQDDDEETDAVRRTPDGQVMNSKIFKDKNYDWADKKGSGAFDCDSGHNPHRGANGGRLPDGGGRGPRQEVNRRPLVKRNETKRKKKCNYIMKRLNLC